MATITRFLTVFDRRTEKFVGEILVPVSLAELQELFGAGKDPMYDCWQVQAQHVEFLELWTGERLDLKSFDYFLEACG